MSAFATLSLLNNAAAEQTFTPANIDSSGVAKWLGTETILDGKKSATMSVALPKNGSTVVRVKQRVMIPIMDTVDTSKKIADAYVDMVFVLPKQATSTNRLDLLAYAKDFLADATTIAAVTNFESIY